MESILNYFLSVELNFNSIWKVVCMLLLAPLVLALIGRFICGKKSVLGYSVSSSIGIIFIYTITAIFANAGPNIQRFFAPLPFVTFQNAMAEFFSFHEHYTVICSELLSMVILAFLMNLVNTLLPKGKHPITWFLLRCVSVISALLLHLLATTLIHSFLPEELMTYAPVILLAVLLLMLITGILKIPVALMLASVNPLISAFYTFFFANIVGKQVTKAVYTTGILSVLLIVLQKIGVVTLSIATSALIIYIPMIILLALLWYFVDRIFA